MTIYDASSGYWQDIQDACTKAVVGDMIYIPSGRTNFIDPGETWIGPRVVSKAGVNIFGAPTQRDANGQVISWGTVLVMPSEVPGNDTVGIPVWFEISGSGTPRFTRFSDIALEGYRTINQSSKTMHTAIATFGGETRIDHSSFKNTTAGLYYFTYADNGVCKGVVDHCLLDNVNGDPGAFVYANRTLDYGIMPYRTENSDYWDTNPMNVFGKYTDYSIYVEDNVFTRWRHCVSAINGMHYVFRHNKVIGPNGFGDIDAHPQYTKVSTRAIEVYDNEFLDPNYIYEQQSYVCGLSGGGCLFYNNQMRDYYFIMYVKDQGTDTRGFPAYAQTPVWIWNNTYLHGGTHHDQPLFFEAGVRTGTNWHLNEGAMPGYAAYPYPHPLTLETNKHNLVVNSNLNSIPFNVRRVA